MYTLLRLQNFRNYDDYALELDEGVNIVVGPNASGKTNLLEALYMISRAKTFRGRAKEVVQDAKDWSRLDSQGSNGDRTLKIQPPAQPRLIIEGKELKRNEKWQKNVPVVLFDPEDLRLLRGSPQRRRDYLDNTLSQADHNYALHLSRYQRALAQRNRLLKKENLSDDELFVWDLKLAEHGSELLIGRRALVKGLNERLGELYSKIAGQKHGLFITYSARIGEKDPKNQLLKGLHDNFNYDYRQGFTSIGPHRDDLNFTLDDSDAHTHASRGETRSLVLALKIIEAEMSEKIHGQKPIILLDDVFSELDASRRRYLIEHLHDHQVIITTTDADAVIDHFSGGEYKIIPTSQN